jgi:hypothetical protein
MKYLLVVLFFCVLCIGCVTSARTNEPIIEKPNLSTKDIHNPNITIGVYDKTDWKTLVNSSKAIVLGEVVDKLWVVDEKKMFGKKSADENTVYLPNLKEGVKGVLIRFKLEETLHSENKINETIDIYVKDGYFPPSDSDTPIFVTNKKYLVFLSNIDESADFKELTVIQPSELSKTGNLFNFKSAFKVTSNRLGYFKLEDLSKKNLNSVRKTITNSE